MKKYVVIVLLLGLASVLQADVEVLLWDFETDLGPWVGNEGCTVTHGENPLTGSMCMVITPDAGWSIGAAADVAIDLIDFTATPIIQLEVSWVADEWIGLDWLNQEAFVVNSGPGGWSQVVATDEVNPDYPGSWDPSWGDHTRTLKYDYTGYPNPAEWGTWLGISVNWGSTTSGSPGNFYIDNIKVIGPDPVQFTPWIRYECEEALLEDTYWIGDDVDCSNGQFVQLEKEPPDYTSGNGQITVTVNVPTAGTYAMRIGQNTGGDLERYATLNINDAYFTDIFSGSITWPIEDAIAGINAWADEQATVEDLFASVVLYGDDDGDWQLWDRWASEWDTDLLNTPMQVDLLEGRNAINIFGTWAWDRWDFIEVEVGYIPRNPSPADDGIAVIDLDTELAWQNALGDLDKVEVWFGETPVYDELDPNSVVTRANYKTILDLEVTIDNPGALSSIPMPPTVKDDQNYTWIVEGFKDVPDGGDPNYPGVFWTFYATDNAAPIADAGEDQYLWLDPNTIVVVTLDGSASDDGDPGPAQPMTYLWTQLAGPTVTIDDANDLITTVTITELGNTIEPGTGDPYEFELTIVEELPPEWTATDTVMVYVNSNSCLSTQEHPDGYLFYGDITGPEGTVDQMVPDCKVDMYDFYEIALNWLNCSNLFEACP
jgi:hypothetical protein